MSTEYNKGIICIIHTIVINNAGGVARALMNAGYEKKNYMDACEIELTLLQVFLCDPKQFFALMQNIEWNAGEKRTNAPEIKDKLMTLINNNNTDNASDWWKQILKIYENG